MTRPNTDNRRGNGDGHRQWLLRREKILLWVGVGLIAAEFINAEIRGGTFHLEFLIGGLALCGISLAQGLDRR